MRAITYTESGGPDVLRLVDRPVPDPVPARSGSAWRSPGSTRPTGSPAAPPIPARTARPEPGRLRHRRRGRRGRRPGAGRRAGLDLGGGLGAARRHGGRVHRRPGAAGRACWAPSLLRARRGLGIPFLTAHRCLTVAESLPDRLGPGSLSGHTVLVAGGAGAVGNAAIQLARWADATVIATVSSPEKAQLAAAAGADHVIDYRQQDVVAEVRKIAPDGRRRDRRGGRRGRTRRSTRRSSRSTARSPCTPATRRRGHVPVRSQMTAQRPLAVRARLHRAGARPRRTPSRT